MALTHSGDSDNVFQSPLTSSLQPEKHDRCDGVMQTQSSSGRASVIHLMFNRDGSGTYVVLNSNSYVLDIWDMERDVVDTCV